MTFADVTALAGVQTVMPLLAQAEPALGVLNLIVQGGSFALLAYLIVYGLPKFQAAIANQQSAERTDFTKALADERRDSIEALAEKRKEFLDSQQAQRAEFANLARDLMATFRAEASAERVACERHFETLAGAIAKGNESTMAAIRAMAEQIQSHAARNQQWSELLKREAEKSEARQRGAKGRESGGQP